MNFNLSKVKKYGLLLLMTAIYFWVTREKTTRAPEPPAIAQASSKPALREAAKRKATDLVPAKTEERIVIPTVIASLPAPPDHEKKKKAISPYTIDDGLVVVHGDVVLGRPADENAPEEGWAEMPTIRLWKSQVIAFYIHPSLSNPERVLEAISFFSGTALKFVPYTDEQDVLIFEESIGVCKSYVGSIGGKQSIWLPRNCGPTEVAHEIMHALGFVHEQNREDRDGAITVNFDNIEEKHRANFEMLPAAFMALSKLAPFDFESLMIYPDNMFAKSARPTMEPKMKDRRIAPGRTLSPSDVDRINAYYGRLP